MSVYACSLHAVLHHNLGETANWQPERDPPAHGARSCSGSASAPRRALRFSRKHAGQIGWLVCPVSETVQPPADGLLSKQQTPITPDSRQIYYSQTSDRYAHDELPAFARRSFFSVLRLVMRSVSDPMSACTGTGWGEHSFRRGSGGCGCSQGDKLINVVMHKATSCKHTCCIRAPAKKHATLSTQTRNTATSQSPCCKSYVHSL